MTQEFHISVTPIGGDQYLVRTMWGERGVPIAEEQVTWAVEEWLSQAKVLMNDPLLGLLRGDTLPLLDDRALTSNSNPVATNLSTFGQTLYNALFQGTIRDSWMTARGVAQHSQEILRLRLGLKDTRLPRLPWEVLYEGDRPIAGGTDIIFSRYHSSFSAHNPSPILPASGAVSPLRILMVLAAPSDQEVLALKQEALHLQTELNAGLQGNDRGSEVELTILEQPGREQLTEKLEHHPYHVFHYAGHSDLSTGGGSLSLVNSKTGLTETLNGDDLAGLLVNNGICMAVFNSCRGGHTATSQEGDSERNLAEALVRRGIPAVLAMAERIPDDVALNLSRLFYRNLKQSYSIDLSLNRARQGLISSYSSHQLYWALPILYLHPQFDGYLLPGGDRDDRPDLLLEALPYPNPDPGAELEVDPLLALGVDFDDADSFDPDDLEFDDPEYEADLETVAQLVNQLSQSSNFAAIDTPPLPAADDESLLPEREVRPNYSQLPDQLYDSPSETTVGICTTVAEAASMPDVEMYSELERMLAEAGKLTDAIALGNRAIQAHPTDARGYRNLAIALLEQGYVPESIAALQQAVQLAPDAAENHNQLGLALCQQGNFAQAVQAYNQAIQLDPEGHEVYQNLGDVLKKQQAIAPVPSVSTPAPSLLPHPRAPLRRRSWGWMIVAVLGSVAILGTGLIGGFRPPQSAVEAAKTQVKSNPNNLSQISTKTVAALATEQLNQGDLVTAQTSITALLNRGALSETSAILTTALTKYPNDPTVNFLMGRLTWQSIRAGNKDYSLEDVRRYWERATKQQPNSHHLNALGSLYYAEGDLDRAQRTWQRSLELLGEDSATNSLQPSSGLPSQETLTASLGMALTHLKLSESQPPAPRASLVNKAIDLRQKVLSSDPVNTQPDALLKNWIWSERAVQDWRSLLATKAAL